MEHALANLRCKSSPLDGQNISARECSGETKSCGDALFHTGMPTPRTSFLFIYATALLYSAIKRLWKTDYHVVS
jgi:hypothetical protein